MRLPGLLALMIAPHLAQGQCESDADSAPSSTGGIVGTVVESIVNANVEKARADAIDAELSAIRAASRGESSPVFFIDIFDGFMPVPNRFVPFASSPEQFNSRYIFGDPSGILLALNGSIKVGRIHSGHQPSASPPEEFEPCNETTLSLYGLTVVEWEFEGFSQVQIYDDEELIRITADNKQLWRAMVDAWNEIRRDREPEADR